MFPKLFFETCVTYDTSCYLEETVMTELSSHMQSQISRICGKVTSTITVPKATKSGMVVAYQTNKSTWTFDHAVLEDRVKN